MLSSCKYRRGGATCQVYRVSPIHIRKSIAYDITEDATEKFHTIDKMVLQKPTYPRPFKSRTFYVPLYWSLMYSRSIILYAKIIATI